MLIGFGLVLGVGVAEYMPCSRTEFEESDSPTALHPRKTTRTPVGEGAIKSVYVTPPSTALQESSEADSRVLCVAAAIKARSLLEASP